MRLFHRPLLPAVFLSALLPLSGDIPLVGPRHGNGDFEDGGNGRPASWHTGFRIEIIERKEEKPDGRPNGSLVVGRKDGRTLGGVLPVGYRLHAGDVLSLEFSWHSAWQWTDEDRVQWRLLSTAGEDAGSAAVVLAEGDVGGKSDRILRQEKTRPLEVPTEHADRWLWLEFSGQCETEHFARVDDVKLRLVPAGPPRSAEKIIDIDFRENAGRTDAKTAPLRRADARTLEWRQGSRLLRFQTPEKGELASHPDGLRVDGGTLRLTLTGLPPGSYLMLARHLPREASADNGSAPQPPQLRFQIDGQTRDVVTLRSSPASGDRLPTSGGSLRFSPGDTIEARWDLIDNRTGNPTPLNLHSLELLRQPYP